MKQPGLKYPNRADMLALLKSREKQGTLPPARAEMPSCINTPVYVPR